MATYSTHSKTGHASADPRHCTLFLKSAATSLANPEALDEQSACQQDSPEDNPNNRPRPSSVVTFSIKMPWFSILPAHFTVFETWIIRFFVYLASLPSIPFPVQKNHPANYPSPAAPPRHRDDRPMAPCIDL